MNRKLSIAAYIIAIHIALVFVVFKSDFVLRVTSVLGLSGGANPHIANMQLYHGFIDAQIPASFVVFLGDSITQGLANSAVFPCSVNYGIGAQTTFDLRAYIERYKSINRAAAVVIMIGINDYYNGSSNGIEERYKEIFMLVDENVPLVLNAIMPIDRPHFSISPILKFNAFLSELCNTRPRCEFVNTWGILIGNEGEVISDKLIDGVHLSSQTYREWGAMLKQAINKVAPGASQACREHFLAN